MKCDLCKNKITEKAIIYEEYMMVWRDGQEVCACSNCITDADEWDEKAHSNQAGI